MVAGKLRHKLTIEKTTHITNAFGEQESTWKTFAEVWGRIRPLTGSERVVAAQTAAMEDAVFDIRYLEGIDPKMRINVNGKHYDISSIQDIEERNRSLVVYARSSST
jgi:SPP1 family predicted phage head-tail adaptor